MNPASPDLPVKSKSPDGASAWAVFALVTAVYGATFCRTLYTGDDGDFLTAMATFGIPHPTGYPLFTLLGRAWMAIIPFGSPAFKINLLTALSGALAVALLFRFLAFVTQNRVVSAAGALTLAFGPTLWRQSLSCEVYAPTCAFLAGILWLASVWRTRPADNRLLCGIAALYGLALTNHLTIALFLPGVLAYVLTARPTLLGRDWRTLLVVAACFIAPLFLYLYLPLAANSSAPVPWGDPRTWENFRDHITGAMFRDRMFGGPEVAQRQGALYLTTLWQEFGVLTALAVWGSVTLWRAGNRNLRALCLLLLYIAAADILYAVNYDIFDVEAYFIPSFVAIAALLTVGGADLLRRAETHLLPRLSEAARSHAHRPVALLLLLLPLLPLGANWTACDRSGNYLEDDFSANILRSAPRGAIVVTHSNVTFSLWYRRFVLGERKDVTPIYAGMTRGMLAYGGWYYRHLARMYPDIDRTYPTGTPDLETRMTTGEFLSALMARAAQEGRPVLVVPDARVTRNKIAGRFPSFDEQVAACLDRVPWGICDRLYPKGAAPSADVLTQENAQIWSSYVTRGLYDGWAFADSQQEHIGRRYTEASLAFGNLAEGAHQSTLAHDAFARVLRLYSVPEAIDGLKRTTE